MKPNELWSQNFRIKGTNINPRDLAKKAKEYGLSVKWTYGKNRKVYSLWILGKRQDLIDFKHSSDLSDEEVNAQRTFNIFHSEKRIAKRG